jgi:hypothetical protein
MCVLRQSVFGRLAGYEDVNDAERLRHDARTLNFARRLGGLGPDPSSRTSGQSVPRICPSLRPLVAVPGDQGLLYCGVITRGNEMSALPPRADMCGATRHVRFVPIADSLVELIRRTIAMPSAAAASDRAAGPGPFAARDRCRAPVLRRLYAAPAQSCGCETLQARRDGRR